MGRSRSVTAVAAFLIDHRGMTTDDALQLIKKTRESVICGFLFVGFLFALFFDIFLLSPLFPLSFHRSSRNDNQRCLTIDFKNTSVCFPVVFGLFSVCFFLVVFS